MLSAFFLLFIAGSGCRAQQPGVTLEELQAAIKVQEAAQEWDAIQLKKLPETTKAAETNLKAQMEQRAKNIAELKAQLQQMKPTAAKGR